MRAEEDGEKRKGIIVNRITGVSFFLIPFALSFIHPFVHFSLHLIIKSTVYIYICILFFFCFIHPFDASSVKYRSHSWKRIQSYSSTIEWVESRSKSKRVTQSDSSAGGSFISQRWGERKGVKSASESFINACTLKVMARVTWFTYINASDNILNLVNDARRQKETSNVQGVKTFSFVRSNRMFECIK